MTTTNLDAQKTIYLMIFLLWVLLWILAGLGAALNAKAGKPKNPEDAEKLPDASKNYSDAEKQAFAEKAERAVRIQTNSLENIPLTCVLMLMGTGVQDEDGGTLDLIILLSVVYTAIRYAYCFFYYFALQPFRSLSYVAGQGVAIVLGITVVLKVLDTENPGA